jgi:hypothetical protein
MMELLQALEDSAFSIWVREAPTVWAYPTVLTLHTAGLAVLVGVNAAFDVRLLGFGRQIPLAEMERFFPAMWVGFWLNAITGAMLFAIDPITKGTTTIFMIKLAFIAAGVILIVMLRRAVYGRGREAATVTSAARAFAVLSLLVWVGAIATGRLMAYV